MEGRQTAPPGPNGLRLEGRKTTSGPRGPPKTASPGLRKEGRTAAPAGPRASGPKDPILSALQSSKEPSKDQLKELLRGSSPDPRHVTVWLSTLAKKRKPVLARELLQVARLQSVEANVFHCGAVLSACEKAPDWRLGLAVLEDMSEWKVARNTVSYNTALSACEKGGQLTAALQLLRQMKEEAVQQDTITFGAAISCFEKSSQWQRGLCLLDEMTLRKVNKDIIIFNAAISACEKGGEWLPALQLLQDVVSEHLEPNVVTYDAAMSACAMRAQWQYALHLLLEMSNNAIQKDVITYNAAINALEKGEEWERALLLMEEMMVVSLERDAFTLCALMKALGDAGAWVQALLLLKGAAAVPKTVAVFNAALGACSRGTQWEGALALLKELECSGEARDLVTLDKVLTSVEGRNEAATVGLLEEARALGMEEILGHLVTA